MEGQTIRVPGVAKTLADCFKHRNKIGLDVALEALREVWLSRSPHAERFVLKGALLMLVWLGEGLRPTSDADLLGFGDLSEESLALDPV